MNKVSRRLGKAISAPVALPHDAMALQAKWTQAPQGRLPPKEQAKQWMSTQVQVKGGGSPGRDAVRRFFERVDEDPAGWYPGRCEGKSGRPQALTPQKRQNVAKSMMAAKKRGHIRCNHLPSL